MVMTFDSLLVLFCIKTIYLSENVENLGYHISSIKIDFGIITKAIKDKFLGNDSLKSHS